MRDLTTGEYIPTELDAEFQLTIGDPFGDGEVLIDEGTPIGVHEVEYEGSVYEVRCTVRLLAERSR